MHDLPSEIAKAWTTFSWLKAGVVFVTYAIIDAMYAWYTLKVTSRKPLASANISFIMHFLLAFGVISYTNNPLYVVPLALGSWVGTYAMVKSDATAAARAALTGDPHHLSE